jgi:DNA end-binding protein Ku
MSRASGTAVARRPKAHARANGHGRTNGHAGANGHARPTRARRANDETGARRATRREAASGPRPVWSGSISFGLVNIPVRLFTAVREQRVAFHLLHDQDKVRLRRKLVSATTGKEVHPEHVVRGYEFAKDHFVIVRDEELEGCAPEKTRAIEITDFVNLDEIDPVYFDRAYYVLPQKGAARSYRLLAEAMKRSGRVGVARVVMYEKEFLAALRTRGDVICLNTMHFGDEVVPATVLEGIAHHAGDVGDRELKAARHVVEAHADDFEPGRYHDQYRECVMKMVQKKAEKEKVVSPPPPEEQDKPQPSSRRAGDLMAALEASLARARKEQGQSPSNGGHRRKSA